MELTVQTPHPRIIAIQSAAFPQFTFISVYAPHASTPSTGTHLTHSAFLALFTRFLATLDTKPLIGGDFNASLPPHFQGPFGYTGRMGTQAQNASLEFQLFLTENRLLSASQFFYTCPTFFGKFSDGTDRRITLDHILYPTTTRRPQWAATTPSPTPSDHRPVIAALPLVPPRPKLQRQAPIPVPDYMALRSPTSLATWLERFRAAYANRSQPQQPSYDAFVHACQVASTSLPSKQRTVERKELYQEKEIMDARDEYRRAASHHNLPMMRHLFAKLSVTRETLRNADIERLLSLFANLKKTMDGYVAIRMVCFKPPPVGRISAPDSETRMSLIVEHCKKQLNNPNRPEKVRFHKLPRPSATAFKTELFSLIELREAVTSLPLNKATGVDKIPPAILKLPAIEHDLLDLCNHLYCMPTLPQSLKTTLLAMIPKSGGNLCKVTGWRYIALMSYIAKLYDRLLLNRLVPHIEPHLRTEQNGFRRRRNTLHHAMALQLVIDHLHRYKKRFGVITFIDFTNAFPSVTWASIRAALKAYNVPLRLIEAVLKVYTGHCAQVKTPDGVSPLFSISAGVLQGDTLAPFLFLIVLDCIMRKTFYKFPDSGVRLSPTLHITDLDFADDIALFHNTIAEAQKFLDIFSRIASRSGLDINPQKTKFMVLGSLPLPHTLTLGQQQLELVTSYKYLGVNTDTDVDITARIGQAWSVMRSLTPAFRSTLSTALKLQLWRSFVEPILLYGTSAYPLTLGRECQLCGVVTRMLKYIRGLSATTHITLQEIYGTTGEACYDMPQIVTSIVSRQLTLLRNLSTSIPDHPLLKILLISPIGKRRASRQFMLRDSIAEHLGLPLSLQALQNLSDNDIAARAQFYEQRVYDRAAVAHARRIALSVLDYAMTQLPPPAEDIPLIETSVGQILATKHLDCRLRKIEELHPNALKLHGQPVTAAALIATFATPQRIPHVVAPLLLPETQVFTISSIYEAAGIFHTALSPRNNLLHLPKVSAFTAEATALRALLTEYSTTALTVQYTHPKLLGKIHNLPRLYYQRMLRKHILWKDICILLRSRLAPLAFALVDRTSLQYHAARHLALTAVRNKSLAAAQDEIAQYPWA
jgi:hypothetical protein